MFDTSLFIGYAIDEVYKKELENLPSSLKSLFIQDESEYLQLIENEETLLLGKFLGEMTDCTTIELVYDHVISLLKCLIPSHSYSKKNLIILALPIKSL